MTILRTEPLPARSGGDRTSKWDSLAQELEHMELNGNAALIAESVSDAESKTISGSVRAYFTKRNLPFRPRVRKFGADNNNIYVVSR